MSAERETQGSVRVFSALVESIERSQAELLEVIEINRRSAEHQAEGMIRELEQEVLELRKRSCALGNLLRTDNYVKCLTVSATRTSFPRMLWYTHALFIHTIRLYPVSRSTYMTDSHIHARPQKEQDSSTSTSCILTV